MLAWALAFVLTCAIELTVIRLLAPPRRNLLTTALLAQAATHPLVWIAMATLPGSQLVRLAGVELWATVVEAALYARFLHLPKSEAFGLSAAANAASLLLVAALSMLF
jgi:hypothetical protein